MLSLLKKKIEKRKNKLLSRRSLTKNKDLFGKAKSDVAFLIATGPSIKKQNLELLKGRDCFSVSNFFLHKDCQNIKPILHFFAPYHQPLEMDNFVEWLRNADNSLPAQTKIILGESDRKIVKDYGIFTNRELYFLSFRDFLSKREKFNLDITKKVQDIQTVPIMALPVLYSMGYKKIYLLGCDANILKNYRQNIEHFFDNRDDIRKHAGSGKEMWSDIEKNMADQLTVIRQYKAYQKVLSDSGVRLINLSPESWLDFLEYEDFEKVVNSF